MCTPPPPTARLSAPEPKPTTHLLDNIMELTMAAKLVLAIQALGYTKRKAIFLYLAAVHSSDDFRAGPSARRVGAAIGIEPTFVTWIFRYSYPKFLRNEAVGSARGSGVESGPSGSTASKQKTSENTRTTMDRSGGGSDPALPGCR